MIPPPDPVLDNTRPLHARALWLWMTVATVIAAILRLYNLDIAGFWIDELYTIVVAADPSATHLSKALGYLPAWLGLWLSGVNPATIPSENLDASTWQQLGITHTAARLGPALVGIITVPIVALASRRILGTGGAVMLALLLATSPWHIYWSQASRFYTLQFLFFTLALIYYFSATRTRSQPQFALAMLMMVLAFLSQPSALIILGIFGIDWLIAHLRSRPLPIGLFEWTAGTTAVAICAAFFLHDYLSAPAEWNQFVAFTGTIHQPPHKLAMGVVYITGPAVVLASLASAWSIRRNDPRLAIFLLSIIILPILIFGLLSFSNFIGLRYLLITLFGWLALAAIGLDRIAILIEGSHPPAGGPRLLETRTLLALSPLAIIIASSAHLLAGYYTNAWGFHPRWPDAYTLVETKAQPGDIIAARHPIVGRYYLQRPDVEHLPLNEEELREMGERVWLIIEDRGGGSRDIGRWIYDHVELKGIYEIAIPRPRSRVEVLLFER